MALCIVDVHRNSEMDSHSHHTEAGKSGPNAKGEYLGHCSRQGRYWWGPFWCFSSRAEDKTQTESAPNPRCVRSCLIADSCDSIAKTPGRKQGRILFFFFLPGKSCSFSSRTKVRTDGVVSTVMPILPSSLPRALAVCGHTVLQISSHG